MSENSCDITHDEVSLDKRLDALSNEQRIAEGWARGAAAAYDNAEKGLTAATARVDLLRAERETLLRALHEQEGLSPSQTWTELLDSGSEWLCEVAESKMNALTGTMMVGVRLDHMGDPRPILRLNIYDTAKRGDLSAGLRDVIASFGIEPEDDGTVVFDFGPFRAVYGIRPATLRWRPDMDLGHVMMQNASGYYESAFDGTLDESIEFARKVIDH